MVQERNFISVVLWILPASEVRLLGMYSGGLALSFLPVVLEGAVRITIFYCFHGCICF
ncbi:hypothetical protein HMPREF1322_0138 [Porphyromonas gingivalis W50]|nr:hypothetical protein HMPREF1322_0138 [Porphyromonas gingivalis W50]